MILRNPLTKTRADSLYPNKTQGNMDIYVSTTGNDVTGDGTVGNPYATATRAIDDIPLYVNHIVNVFFAAGVYSGWPKTVDVHTGETGEVRFQAVGSYPVVAGPFAVVSRVAEGSYGYRYTVSGVSWSVGQFYGLMIRYRTGANAGIQEFILKNSANSVSVMGPYYPLQPGDEFEIVNCPVRIEMPERNYRIHSAADSAALGFQNDLGHFVFAGIHLENTNVLTQRNLSLQGPGTFVFSLAKVTGMTVDCRDDTGIPPISWASGNGIAPLEPQILHNPVWTSKFFISHSKVLPVSHVSGEYALMVNGKIAIWTFGIIAGVLFSPASFNVGLANVSVGPIVLYTGYLYMGSTYSYHCLGKPCVEMIGGTITVSSAYLGDTTQDGLDLQNSNGKISSTEGALITGYAVRMRPGSSIITNAVTGLNATGGDIVLSNGDEREFPANDENVNNDVEVARKGTVDTETIQVTFSDSGDVPLVLLPAGTVVIATSVKVTTDFDAGATVKVGDSVDDDRLMTTVENDLASPDLYQTLPWHTYAAATQIVANMTTVGATQGTALITVKYLIA